MTNSYSTVPNQRTVNIHRQPLDGDFLGIKNENWQYAARDLGAHALRLYLYLASNADGYRFALSPVAIRNAVGMPRSTYHDQFRVLVDKGYLVHRGGSTFDFYEVPIPRRDRPAFAGYVFENSTAVDNAIPQPGNPVMPEDIEINNRLYPDTATNSADIPSIEEIEREMGPEEAEEYRQFLAEKAREEAIRKEEEACGATYKIPYKVTKATSKPFDF